VGVNAYQTVLCWKLQNAGSNGSRVAKLKSALSLYGTPGMTRASAKLSLPPGGGGGGDAARGEVSIADFAFAPDPLRAQVGQRVTWENRDTGVTHTVSADGGAFNSGDLASGKRFSFVFGAAGSFAYHCAIHRDMRGTVSVGP